MGIRTDVLRVLSKNPSSYEDLAEVFPDFDVDSILTEMEYEHLVEKRGETWFITRKGLTFTKGKRLAPLACVVPICFFLLSFYFYLGYTDVHHDIVGLLQEQGEAEYQLSTLGEQKEDAEAFRTAQLAVLAEEKGKTSQLDSSYEHTKKDVESLEQELNKFECLENCTPDTFVTVDNAYVKAKTDEITAGLTTLKEKQKAVFEFVRDNIEDDDSIFRTGRTDYWEYPEDILERGKGHFEDKYLLLMTMLRMVGTAPEHVKFIAGEVDGSDNWIWVEVYDGETWWILDPFEGYEFEEESKEQFYREHEVVVLWWFNDGAYREGD